MSCARQILLLEGWTNFEINIENFLGGVGGGGVRLASLHQLRHYPEDNIPFKSKKMTGMCFSIPGAGSL